QRTVRHGEVVAREVQLGVAPLRKEHLPRIRDRDLTSCDRQELSFGVARHRAIVRDGFLQENATFLTRSTLRSPRIPKVFLMRSLRSRRFIVSFFRRASAFQRPSESTSLIN